MRILFQSTSDRLKLMSWHRRFCKSSPVQAKQFVDSIPCEIEVDSCEIEIDRFGYWGRVDIEGPLKDIAVFEVLPNVPHSPPENFPISGCPYQPDGIVFFPNCAFISN